MPLFFLPGDAHGASFLFIYLQQRAVKKSNRLEGSVALFSHLARSKTRFRTVRVVVHAAGVAARIPRIKTLPAHADVFEPGVSRLFSAPGQSSFTEGRACHLADRRSPFDCAA